MKKFKRGFVLLITVCMLLSVLSGCGGDSTGSSANTEASTATGTDSGEANSISGKIVVGGWPSGDDAFKAAEAGFLELYQDVEIEYQFSDTTAYHQALQTSLAAGSEAPDVAMVEGAYIAQYVNSPVLENLLDEPYNAGDIIGDFVSLKSNQAYSLDGTKLVALPWDIGPTSYFYRRDVFEDAGLPSDPDEVYELISTWDGMMEVAEKIYIEGERWFYPNATYFYTMLFMNRDYFDETLNLQMDREGGTEALEFALKVRSNGYDANTSDMWSTEAYAGYADGSIASVATGAWFGGFLKTDIDPDGEGNWGVTALPAGMTSSNWGGSFVVLPSQSENKEAAWAYIEYMLATPEGQNAMFEAVDYFPAYEPAWDDTEIYEAEDSYFGGQKTKALWVDIADAFPAEVFTTISDTTAEDALYQTVNAGLEAGNAPETIIADAESAIMTACAETLEQQKQNMIDAGVWIGD